MPVLADKKLLRQVFIFNSLFNGHNMPPTSVLKLLGNNPLVLNTKDEKKKNRIIF